MSKIKLMVTIFLTLGTVLLLACAPQVAPTAMPAPQAPAPGAAAAPAKPAAMPTSPAKPAWQEEWDRVVAAAKREGTVVTYATGRGIITLRQPLKATFGIDAEVIAGPSAMLSQKTMQEHRAGLYLVDVSMMGTTSMLSIFRPAGMLQRLDEALILPEVTNPQMWQGNELNWIDPAQKTTLAFSGYVTGLIALNTNLVKPEEVKSWRDLLNPKWKGQIVLQDVTLGSGPALVWVTMISKLMGWDYMRELAKQQPIIIANDRLQIEWLARGKNAIALGYRPEVFYEFWKLGAPIVAITAVEGAYINAGPGSVALLKNLPHPNAAQVLVNYLLTKQGQILFAEHTGNPSRRVDVPTADLNPAVIPDPKVKYLRADTEESILDRPEASKIARELFLPLK